jgi:uncharacterized membrane protein
MANHWRTRLLFPSATLDAIEQAIKRAERAHSGEIRFAIETALTPLHILKDIAPSERALDVFSLLRVWDTEHNNGVLIYVQMADRTVQIVADRGAARRASRGEWDGVCRLMEEHYQKGRFEAGSIAGIDAVGTLLARHFARETVSSVAPSNQLPDRPTLL